MIDTPIGIAYTADLNEARAIMLEIAQDPRVLRDPAPQVFVAGLENSSVTLTQRIWINAGDWWSTKIDMIERIKGAFDAAGIEIPYNKLDIRMRRLPGEESEAANDAAMPTD